MNKFMLNIKIRYDTFSKSEKKIADVLLQKPDNVLSLYISDFAKVCKTSEATIVRFAKHLGFDGYQQFKIAIAQEAKTHPINERIKYDDSAAEIFQKVCEDIYCSLEKTKKTLNGDTLEKCCQAILNSNNILVFGLGNSASIAIDASHKMFRLGLNVHRSKQRDYRNFTFGTLERHHTGNGDGKTERCYHDSYNQSGKVSHR